MKKLINEYTAKIELLDIAITEVQKAITDFRNGKSSVVYFDENDARAFLREFQAKRQCYVQFIKDLEDYA